MRYIIASLILFCAAPAYSQCPIESAEHRPNYITTTEDVEQGITKYVNSKKFRLDATSQAEVFLYYKRFKDDPKNPNWGLAGIYRGQITLYISGIPDIENCKVTYEDMTTQILTPVESNIANTQNKSEATFLIRGDLFDYAEEYTHNGQTAKVKMDALLDNHLDISKNIVSMVFLSSKGTKKIIFDDQAQLNIACILHRFHSIHTQDIVKP